MLLTLGLACQRHSTEGGTGVSVSVVSPEEQERSCQSVCGNRRGQLGLRGLDTGLGALRYGWGSSPTCTLALPSSAHAPHHCAHHSQQLERLPGCGGHGAEAALKGLHVGPGRPEAQQVEVSLEGPMHG